MRCRSHLDLDFSVKFLLYLKCVLSLFDCAGGRDAVEVTPGDGVRRGRRTLQQDYNRGEALGRREQDCLCSDPLCGQTHGQCLHRSAEAFWQPKEKFCQWFRLYCRLLVVSKNYAVFGNLFFATWRLSWSSLFSLSLINTAEIGKVIPLSFSFLKCVLKGTVQKISSLRGFRWQPRFYSLLKLIYQFFKVLRAILLFFFVQFVLCAVVMRPW